MASAKVLQHNSHLTSKVFFSAFGGVTTWILVLLGSAGLSGSRTRTGLDRGHPCEREKKGWPAFSLPQIPNFSSNRTGDLCEIAISSLGGCRYPSVSLLSSHCPCLDFLNRRRGLLSTRRPAKRAAYVSFSLELALPNALLACWPGSKFRPHCGFTTVCALFKSDLGRWSEIDTTR